MALLTVISPDDYSTAAKFSDIDHITITMDNVSYTIKMNGDSLEVWLRESVKNEMSITPLRNRIVRIEPR